MNEVITAEEAQQNGRHVAAIPEAAQSSQSRALMSMIERAVLNPEYPIDRLQSLFELKKQWEADEARKAYVAAMARFKADPPTIMKDKHVSYNTKGGTTTEYDHATLGAVCAAIVDGLAKQGISHSWETTQAENHVKVTCVLTHEFGHSERVSLHSAYDDSGGKNQIQALGSAITYLQRYTLFAATGLAAMEDDDGRGTGGGGNSELEQTPAPEGYEAARKQLAEQAKKGTNALRTAWEKVAEPLRMHATSKDAKWWEERKKEAAEIDRLAKLVR